MSAANPLMLLSAQWAILGVLVVVGLFFVWRRLNQIDEKLVALQWRAPAEQPAGRHVSAAVQTAPAGGEYDGDGDDGDDGDSESRDAALMRAIFEQALPIDGGAPTFMMFSSDADGAAYGQPQVTIEDADADGADGVEASEPGTDMPAGRVSKTQLRKMSTEALKELLHAKGMPVEGNKNALVQRLAEAEQFFLAPQ